jgi:hypothetical protein
MTELTKPIKRETPATVFEKSQSRNIIVSIEPAGRSEAVIGVRLKGTRQTYRVGINSVYNLAVQHYVNRIEKLAKRLHKEEKVPLRTARARARKQIDKELKS